VDRSGDVYVTGAFDHQVDFGGPILDSGATIAAYVAKLSTTDGSCLWAEPVQGQGDVRASAVAADRAGDVYTVVSFAQAATAAPAADAIELEKMDSSGTVLWARPVVQTTDTNATGLAVDRAGNAFVTGNFLGTGMPIDFDPIGSHAGGADLLAPGQGTSNIFIERFASNGSFTWLRGIGGDSNFRTSTGIALDKRDDVFITGYFEGSTDFGGLTLRGDGLMNAFVAELSSRGKFLRAVSEGGSDVTKANAIAVDRFGFVIITGEFGGTTQIGGFLPLTVGGGQDTADADAAAGMDLFAARLKLGGHAHRGLASERFGVGRAIRLATHSRKRGETPMPGKGQRTGVGEHGPTRIANALIDPARRARAHPIHHVP
jgi:hypothetical protein